MTIGDMIARGGPEAEAAPIWSVPRSLMKMAAFEQVTEDEFDDAIESSPSSQTFKEQYARFSPHRDDHCFIHRGPLILQEHFAAPGFCTLIIGDLTVDGFVDLSNPERYNEGGLFVVIGNVSCTAFAGEFGKCTFIDGNLIASEVILNQYEDSSLVVTGDLKTKLFYGWDIWAEVGGVADFEYGDGYCLPIGYRNASAQSIHARRDTPAHLVLRPDILDDRDSLKWGEACEHLRRGESILRAERDIGRVLKPKLSALGKERLAQLSARAEAGETITEIDLRGCELRFVPEDIRKFSGIRRLYVSQNAVNKLPDWIAEFSHLEILEAEDCGLPRIPPAIANIPTLKQLLVHDNHVTDLSITEHAYPNLERLQIGGDWHSELVDNFTANLDLGRFPKLRFAEQRFYRDPKFEFDEDCDFWDTESLEFLRFGAVFKTRMPAGIAKATALKGLECGLSRESLRSAIDLLPQLAHLQVFVVRKYWDYAQGDWDLTRADMLALSEALPHTYVCGQEIAQSNEYQSWLRALKFDATEEQDPLKRRNKFARAAELADSILSMLPDDVESCRFACVAWLRWYSLLAQANRCIFQSNPDLASAKALFDIVQSEAGSSTNDVSMERVRTALREAGLNV
jgi:hypothetical protein